jgi:hypothetical protein
MTSITTTEAGKRLYALGAPEGRFYADESGINQIKAAALGVIGEHGL